MFNDRRRHKPLRPTIFRESKPSAQRRPPTIYLKRSSNNADLIYIYSRSKKSTKRPDFKAFPKFIPIHKPMMVKRIGIITLAPKLMI